MDNCVESCSSSGDAFASTCPDVFDEFLSCMARNGVTCPRGEPVPADACNDVMMRLQSCAGATDPPMPGTADAGVAPSPDA